MRRGLAAQRWNSASVRTPSVAGTTSTSGTGPINASGLKSRCGSYGNARKMRCC